MKYAAIQEKANEHPVSRQCEVLGVSEGGYYAWRKRAPSQRKKENAALKMKIYATWKHNRSVYGVLRIQDALKDDGLAVGRHRIARLMRTLGIQGKMARKRRPKTTKSDPTHIVAPNVLNRQFQATRCDEVWLTDITYVDTDEGYLYLAGVMDMFSRRIVGMAMADHLRTELVEAALNMALYQRQPQADLLHHSDRGSQYTSDAYRSRLKNAGISVSMSRSGSCLDNAPMESLWATLKRECADEPFPSHAHARSAIFSYGMGFYNLQRKHSALGYLSPAAFERETRETYALN